MSIILNIDTAVQVSSVCLAQDNQALATKTNPAQKDSAAWLHVAIKELLEENSITPGQIDAIAVSEGPGSYTGLRVGMSTAKGLCYVLQKPLITINTLKIMAAAAQDHSTFLLCPMIDARRMEVFTAVLDQQLNWIQPPSSQVLNEHCFVDLLESHIILFFGNGSTKFQPVMHHKNARFSDVGADSSAMKDLSYEKFLQQEFADLAYSHPFYGKDFHSPVKLSL